MLRIHAAVGLLAMTAVSAVSAEVERPRIAPDALPGLIAWYEAGSLRRDGRGPLTRWPDASGNGHDLLDAETGMPAIAVPKALNGQPALQVRKQGTFRPETPFTLRDHTIFIVFRSELDGRGLFSGKEGPGLVLADPQGANLVDAGVYGADGGVGDWRILLLQREGAKLASALNGAEPAGGGKSAAPLEVTRFFKVPRTRFVTLDGNGLWLAELLFYDRALDTAERDAVTLYLSEKFGLPAATTSLFIPAEKDRADAPVRLRTLDSMNLNEADGAFVRWTVTAKIAAPLQHDPKDQAASELTCEADATKVRLRLIAATRSDDPDTAIRWTLLVNGERYLADQAVSPGNGTVELASTTELNAGDRLEVVAWREGAEGTVTLDPTRTMLLAEVD